MMTLLLEFGERVTITSIEVLDNGKMHARLTNGNYLTFSRLNVISISVRGTSDTSYEIGIDDYIPHPTEYHD